MPVFRAILLLLLIAGLGCFALYIATGQMRWRALGLRLVKWTVIAGLVFFAVLAAERLIARV
ncbi:MAG: hypothetical protein ABL900_04935 [Burkholderiaceae bacterium]